MFEKGDYVIGAIVGGGLAILMGGNLLMGILCIVVTLIFASQIPD